MTRVLAAIGLLCAVCGAAPASAQDLPPETPVLLRSGDVVVVQVWQNQPYSGEFRINDRGVLSHPKYQQVVAAGRSIEEVDAAVRRVLLVEETDPSIIVEGRLRIAVSGQVRQANVYDLRPGMTITEVVAQTGGLGEGGGLDNVRLRRDGTEYELDLTELTAPDRFVTIRSGDEIFIPRRRDFFREYVAPVSSVLAAVFTFVRLVDRLP